MKRYGFNSTPPIDLPDDEVLASGVESGGCPPDRARPDRPGSRRDRPGAAAGDAAADGRGRRRGSQQRQADAPQIWNQVRRSRRAHRQATSNRPSTASRVKRPTDRRRLTAMMKQVVEEGTGTNAAIEGHRRRRQDRNRRQVAAAATTRPGSSASRRPTIRRSRSPPTVECTTDSAATSPRRSPRSEKEILIAMTSRQPLTSDLCPAARRIVPVGGNRGFEWLSVAKGPSIDGRYRVSAASVRGGWPTSTLAEDTHLRPAGRAEGAAQRFARTTSSSSASAARPVRGRPAAPERRLRLRPRRVRWHVLHRDGVLRRADARRA